MILGIIGRGYWGDVYAKTLKEMEIQYWQAGRDMSEWNYADGVIIASSGESHYEVAKHFMANHVPVLIEKPLCMSTRNAENLLLIAEHTDAIAFVGHTHLFSPAWRKFKDEALSAGILQITSRAGGPCKLGLLWDWGPHDVSMCIDLMGQPTEVDYEGGIKLAWGKVKADIHLSHEETERFFEVLTPKGPIQYTGRQTKKTPLEVLLGEFVAAIDYGAPSLKWLRLGVRVTEVLDIAQMSEMN